MNSDIEEMIKNEPMHFQRGQCFFCNPTRFIEKGYKVI
jgi:hypothetical protein